jgi:hypothetical protein
MSKLSLGICWLVAILSISAAGDLPPSFPMQPAKDDFQPNVLDCSSFVEAPTGKHGFVTARGDRFVFEDGTPVRFFGSQMNPLPKAQLDYTARRMRRQGINITRLHGLEFLNDRNGKTSFDYSATGWDRLDYLIYKLGENGIYIILDVNYPNIYPFKPGDNIPGLPKEGRRTTPSLSTPRSPPSCTSACATSSRTSIRTRKNGTRTIQRSPWLK